MFFFDPDGLSAMGSMSKATEGCPLATYKKGRDPNGKLCEIEAFGDNSEAETDSTARCRNRGRYHLFILHI